jgi:hypothetical protein
MTSRFNVGASIRRAQKKARIGNSDLVEHFGVCYQTICRWRSKEDNTISTTIALADFFGMDHNDFIELGREHESEGSSVAISEAG